MRSRLQEEFERIIEDTSGGTHNSQDWWDEDLCETETIIEGLCRRLEQEAMKHPIKLPRVSPEKLVEGEWYAGTSLLGDRVYGPIRFDGEGEDRITWWDAASVSYSVGHGQVDLFGPLPHFEIEET